MVKEKLRKNLNFFIIPGIVQQASFRQYIGAAIIIVLLDFLAVPGRLSWLFWLSWSF